MRIVIFNLASFSFIMQGENGSGDFEVLSGWVFLESYIFRQDFLFFYFNLLLLLRIEILAEILRSLIYLLKDYL